MLAGLLAELDIPVLVRRTTVDVPDMLAGGPRELLVPADRALEARAAARPDGADRVRLGAPAAGCATMAGVSERVAIRGGAVAERRSGARGARGVRRGAPGRRAAAPDAWW